MNRQSKYRIWWVMKGKKLLYYIDYNNFIHAKKSYDNLGDNDKITYLELVEFQDENYYPAPCCELTLHKKDHNLRSKTIKWINKCKTIENHLWSYYEILKSLGQKTFFTGYYDVDETIAFIVNKEIKKLKMESRNRLLKMEAIVDDRKKEINNE